MGGDEAEHVFSGLPLWFQAAASVAVMLVITVSGAFSYINRWTERMGANNAIALHPEKAAEGAISDLPHLNRVIGHLERIADASEKLIKLMAAKMEEEDIEREVLLREKEILRRLAERTRVVS
jgi:hypothetical protein